MLSDSIDFSLLFKNCSVKDALEPSLREHKLHFSASASEESILGAPDEAVGEVSSL